MSVSKAITAPFHSNSDLELAERHRYGDEAAFEEVYTRYAPMVYAVCIRMSGESSRAQDLSQEVFLRVFRSLGRFRGRSSLRTWIYRVAINHCRSSLGRRRLRTESLDDGASIAKVADSGRGPEDMTVAKDTGRVVAEALLELPGRFREAVVLRDLEDLTYREIASILGIRLVTVRSRISRGRDRLRVLLERRL